VSFKSMPEGG